QHTIEIVIDRLIMKSDMSRSRIADALEQALKRAKGAAVLSVQALGDRPAQELHFSENYTTAEGDFNFEEIEPRLFSFNSPYGACGECHGLGFKKEFDPVLIAPNRNLSIAGGALRPFTAKTGKETLHEYMRGELDQYQSARPCPVCKGKRLKPEALAVTVSRVNISDLCALSLEKIAAFFEELKLTEREQIIARQVIKEIRTRVGFLLNV